MNIQELYDRELEYWRYKNIQIFGLSLINKYDKYEDLQKSIEEDCKLYWNVDNPCKVAKALNDGLLDANFTQKTPNSYILKLNPVSLCTEVFADYSGQIKKVLIIPTPSIHLTWYINGLEYTPRTTAIRNKSIFRVDNVVRCEYWQYDIDKKEFKCRLKKNPYDISTIYSEHLPIRAKILLQSVLSEELTEFTFEKALELVPIFKSNSLFNYEFSRFEFFENIIFNSNRYSTPIKDRVLSLASLFISQTLQKDNSDKLGQLVIVDSPIMALESFRTSVNIYNKEGSFTPEFSYVDATGFFDSFKTSTTKQAGRQRLLLDNITVHDGLLWINENGVEKSMFDYVNNPQKDRLSCLSSSPFCNNDKAKRIMMTAKLSSQAVPLKDEVDSLTHRILARVGYMDIDGYTFADAIIISESFAKKLTTYSTDIITLSVKNKTYRYLYKKYMQDINYKLTVDDLVHLYPTVNRVILDNYKNVQVTAFDYIDNVVRIFLSWEIPFNIGDKISNLHGAKGVVGLILPDDKMPKLTKKAGNMDAGPLEVIISGFSTIRRGSLGQIFEAFALANDIKEDTLIADIAKKYKTKIDNFVKNSIVEYNNEKITAPIGICNIIRVYHHSPTHASVSAVNSIKKLKLGEMEKLNLVANDCINILKELSIRSLQKAVGSRKLVKDMEITHKLPNNTKKLSQFGLLLKSLGYIINVNNKPLIGSDLSQITDEEAKWEVID